MKEKITLVDNLPFIQVSISHQGRSKIIDNVLIDTGSGSTIFKVDIFIEDNFARITKMQNISKAEEY